MSASKDLTILGYAALRGSYCTFSECWTVSGPAAGSLRPISKRDIVAMHIYNCCVPFANKDAFMRNLVSTILLLGLTIIGCSQAREKTKNKLTTDFFYGAWGDSLETENGGRGIIFGTKSDFYIIWNGNISGGDNLEQNTKLIYNLILDKDPIEVEIVSKDTRTDKIEKKIIGTIQVIDSLHIMWKLYATDKELIDSVKLTRASNQ